ncbi:MAG: hypothetical protein IPI28_04620 [Candidatus Omnitrophica bacterium]|nr:hypothetical protein [Candidatus Omnitrophota bacterium]
MEKEAFDLITAGSVFRGEDPWFLATIRSLVLPHAPSANFRFPLYAPAVGAGLLALEAVGIQATDSVLATWIGAFLLSSDPETVLAQSSARYIKSNNNGSQ